MSAAPHRRIPGYLQHKPTGQARVILDGRTYYLGSHGTPESRTRYNRLVAEWLANDRCLPGAAAAPSTFKIADLIDGFLDHAEHEYRFPDGSPSKEAINVRYPMRELFALFSDLPAAEFGPRDLKRLRDRMIEKGWCRRLVNQRISVVRRAFRWAVADERIPPTVLLGLAAVPGLRRGRSGAKESDPVLPVSEADVRKTIPELTPTLQAMVWFQWFTGCRPGEACNLLVEDVDRSGTVVDGVQVWGARLRMHKTAMYGKDREILVGPRA